MNLLNSGDRRRRWQLQHRPVQVQRPGCRLPAASLAHVELYHVPSQADERGGFRIGCEQHGRLQRRGKEQEDTAGAGQGEKGKEGGRSKV